MGSQAPQRGSRPSLDWDADVEDVSTTQTPWSGGYIRVELEITAMTMTKLEKSDAIVSGRAVGSLSMRKIPTTVMSTVRLSQAIGCRITVAQLTLLVTDDYQPAEPGGPG
jgi:hypothetical protein